MERITGKEISLRHPRISICKVALIQGLGILTFLYLFFHKELGILGIVLFCSVLMGLLILLEPKFGLLLCIAFNITSASAFFLGGLYLGVAAVTIAAWILRGLATEPNFVRSPQNQLIFAFTAVAIFSLSFCTDLGRGIESMMVYLKVIALYLLIVNIIDSAKFLKVVLWIIILSGLTISLLGMYQFLSSPHFAIWMNRIASTRQDPNNLALTLVSVFPVVIALLRAERGKKRKIFLFFVCVIIFFTIPLTLSRGGFLALSAILFVLVTKARKKKIAGVLLISIIGCSIVLLPGEVWERVGTISVESFDRSIQMRMMLLKGGLKMFLDHPLVGVGIGNFIIHSVQYSGVFIPSFAHNMFIHVAAEMGIFGILLFSSLIWITWRSLRQVQRLAFRKNDSFFQHVSQGLEISLIGFCVGSLFLSQHFNKMLWIIIALTVSVKHIYFQRQKLDVHSKEMSLN